MIIMKAKPIKLLVPTNTPPIILCRSMTLTYKCSCDSTGYNYKDMFVIISLCTHLSGTKVSFLHLKLLAMYRKWLTYKIIICDHGCENQSFVK